MDLTDFFMVIRNGSKYTDNTPSYSEEGYQFVGNQVVFLNRRDLKVAGTRDDIYDFKKTIIDPTNAEKLIVLNVYNATSTTYEVFEFVYGNFASAKPITVPATPPYITFS